MRFICLCAVAWLYAAPSLALESDRIFDIVPAEGQTVEMVDGATVLRQVGQSFGVVLSFRPDSPTQGWIFAAVLNLGKEPLRVSSSGFSAVSGDDVLRIASTRELIWLVRPPSRGTLDTFTGGSTADFKKANPARTAVMASTVPKDKVKEFIAMLFPTALLAPGRVVKGELLLDLPTRHADEPASFVLRVSFGDERMEVTYREREG